MQITKHVLCTETDCQLLDPKGSSCGIQGVGIITKATGIYKDLGMNHPHTAGLVDSAMHKLAVLVKQRTWSLSTTHI